MRHAISDPAPCRSAGIDGITLSNGQPMTAALLARGRIPALDGLRGVLAVFVVLHHVACFLWVGGLGEGIAHAVVCIFFAMSGLVLTRSYDGHLGAFLLRRLVRLWPLFAVCMLTEYALKGQQPVLDHLLFWPPFQGYAAHPIVVPAWSLFVEIWAAPVIPLVAEIAGSHVRCLALGAACAGFALVFPPAGYLPLFVLGGWLGRFRWRCAALESAPAQFLGKISYSLYLTHWVVLSGVYKAIGYPLCGVASLPLMIGVAHMAWRYIELPSVRLSRQVAELWKQGAVRKMRHNLI
jgi:peptidoglycan/LPS O-acetylase OafA/YrhL